MTFTPRPIPQSELLPTQWFARWTGWSKNTQSSDGVTRSEAGFPFIASEGFACCSALLIENMDRPGETSLFHFFPHKITQGQVDELNRLKTKGGNYRAVFVKKATVNRMDDPELPGYIAIGANAPLMPESVSIKSAIDTMLPNIQWHETIKVPNHYWALGYDADERKMHVAEMHGTERHGFTYECYDYGDPFLVTPKLQISTDGVEHKGPDKGIQR